MAEAAVAFLLEQLSTLIREEHSLLRGVREDAEDIKTALERLTATLRVADEREESDPQVQAWVKQARELAYDAEDVLDEFLFRFGACRTGGGFCAKIQSIYTSLQNLRARRRLAIALRRIKARVNKISQEQPSLPTSSTGTIHNHNKWWYDSRGDALLLEESDLVGIGNSKQDLVNVLLAGDDDLRVHSVVGMGGLGKTTLVKKAYDDAEVINHFQHRVWVTVSETFKIELLLKDAIKQLVEQTKQQLSKDFKAMEQTKQQLPKDFDAMGCTRLKEFLKNILSSRRYVIVLDDIWSFDVWDAIRYAFPEQSVGSRIVITSRNSEIGHVASRETCGVVYPLEPLSPEDSWSLFCRKTFLGGSCPQHLENISENILKRCRGLPLAIVVIAGVLATKSEDVKEWENFQHSLNIQVASNDRMKNMKNLLSLSYYDLPYHLKYCLLYLSIFPRDVDIEKIRVIRLWIAEGFVRENSQQVKEEVAEAYLNELLHRNLIQIVDKTDAGRIRRFQVHDILREVILSKLVEQNFAVIATGQTIEQSNKIRRLAIHRFDDHILKSTSSKLHLRSLQFFEPITSSMASLSSLKLLSVGYIPLKVLDLRDAQLEEIPKEVFNLLHLKYLSLRRTELRNIPKSIGRLQNLETLDLKDTNVIELPAEILKLRKLRHLLVYRYLTQSDGLDETQSFNAPFKIGGLLSLQKLCYVQANDTNGSRLVSEIGKLTQLRRLGVSKLRQEDGKEFCSSLEKLTNLCSLSLGSAAEDEMLDIQHPLFAVPRCLRTLDLRGSLERVPQWLSSLVSLTRLNLIRSRLPEDPLPFLQDLPMLVTLMLLESSYEGEGLCFKAEKFSKLKYLEISKLEALKWIRVEKGAMPLLENFYMEECKLLERVPVGVEHLSNLKRIGLDNMANKLMHSLEPNDERSGYYEKISHIPEIFVWKFVNGVLTTFRNGQEMRLLADKVSQICGDGVGTTVDGEPFVTVELRLYLFNV